MSAQPWRFAQPQPGVGWLSEYIAHSDEVHVSPVEDWVGHELTEDCICGPQVVPVKRPSGGVGWLITHASLDHREAYEQRCDCDDDDH